MDINTVLCANGSSNADKERAEGMKLKGLKWTGHLSYPKGCWLTTMSIFQEDERPSTKPGLPLCNPQTQYKFCYWVPEEGNLLPNFLSHVGRPNPTQRQRTRTTKGSQTAFPQCHWKTFPGASFYWELWSPVTRKKHRTSVLGRCSVCWWQVKQFCCLLHHQPRLWGESAQWQTEFRGWRMTRMTRLQNLEGKSSVQQKENIDFTMLCRWMYWQGGCDPADLFVRAPLSSDNPTAVELALLVLQLY